MVFSGNAFLFFFLTITLALYYPLRKWRAPKNWLLTFMSLLFYAWGEPAFVFVMLASIALNWLFGRLIARARAANAPRARAYLIVIITFDVALLGVFKYLGFVITNLNSAFSLGLPNPEIALPIGISFFTFQAISYVADVYRGKAQARGDFLGVCLYISFFPQLIAGPIVRYETVAAELDGRNENMDDFCEGVRRFMTGLCKKAILADNLAIMVDITFALDKSQMSVGLSWLSAIAYLMQVYYDFSGYSDMAIGLGRMFGFHFPENFNFPFLSKSVTEFWRRWHISLCAWFRDYVFFPLGGSRVKSRLRLLFNMFVVWALTGLWHGAEWTYVAWGVGFFVVLALEKLTGLAKWMEKHWAGHLYAMLTVVVITVLIRSENIRGALGYYQTMCFMSGAPVWNALTTRLMREFGLFMLAAAVISVPIGEYIERALKIPNNIMQALRGAGLLAAAYLAVSYVVNSGYSPFIYFNF